MEWKKEKDARVQKFKNEDIKYKGKLLKSQNILKGKNELRVHRQERKNVGSVKQTHVLVTAGTCFSLVSVPGFWSMCAKMLQLLVLVLLWEAVHQINISMWLSEMSQALKNQSVFLVAGSSSIIPGGLKLSAYSRCTENWEQAQLQLRDFSEPSQTHPCLLAPSLCWAEMNDCTCCMGLSFRKVSMLGPIPCENINLIEMSCI